MSDSEFARFEAEDRRLAVLKLLTTAPANTANEYVLRDLLAQFGHNPAVGALRSDFTHLEQEATVVVQKPGGVWVLTLTQLGDDVAGGRTTAPGIKRPRPGG